MIEELKLKYEHEQFVQEYLVDFNATQAYSRVYKGCSEDTANTNGPKLLKNPDIQKAIEEGTQDKIKRAQNSQDRVLSELSLIAFQNIKNLYGEDGNLLPVHSLPDEVAKTIQCIDIQELAGGAEIGGEAGIKHIATRVNKIKLHDKKGALTDYGKHLGLFPNKHEVDLPQGFTVNISSKDAGNL